MKLKGREISGREKDEASVRLLGQLRERLYSDDISSARRAAFNLSWMQEDGLGILKEALLSSYPRKAKTAAAYGLRRMQGRMKKMALEVLKQGLEHANRDTRSACRNALALLKSGARGKSAAKTAKGVVKFRIREVPARSGRGVKMTRNSRGELLENRRRSPQ